MQESLATRPRGDLDQLAVPKGEARPSTPPDASLKAYAHTLSLRLTAEEYRRLRLYVRAQEDANRRVTHQGVIEAALREYLDRNGG